ncbi:MAG TPA: dihydroorotate dehydrogenase electron transfer subunit [Eggerthellaceae bacterium]|nr:dihydroorotate dehydrogenase electron transfer subunit [Eggerthellaceae bacterium]
MTALVNEAARLVSNEQVGPRLYLMVLESPQVAATIAPGQFVHMKIPDAESHVLRRPFSVYARSVQAGTIEVLYQVVGSLTRRMPDLRPGSTVETIGPVGNTWSAPRLFDSGEASCALLVGGGVGAAPLYLLAERLAQAGREFDVVLGAQTRDALVARKRYEQLLGRNPICATDDGSYGHAGFCTGPVQERLEQGSLETASPYDYVAVCGPEPLMIIVAGMAVRADVRCEVSMEKRMACGIGACLSCVVETTAGKRRSCVDGPVFDASEVVW